MDTTTHVDVKWLKVTTLSGKILWYKIDTMMTTCKPTKCKTRWYLRRRCLKEYTQKTYSLVDLSKEIQQLYLHLNHQTSHTYSSWNVLWRVDKKFHQYDEMWRLVYPTLKVKTKDIVPKWSFSFDLPFPPSFSLGFPSCFKPTCPLSFHL